MNLTQKIIVITGGTSGIGYEVVKQLHPHNQIIAIGRNPAKLEKLSQEFQGIITLQADLSKPEEVAAVARSVVEDVKEIDVLINNAGVQFTPEFLDDNFRYESIAREIAVNFTSVCNLTFLLLPALQHDNTAIILNVGSGLGLLPKTSSAVYCATKGAINIFSQSLGYQLESSNIKVLQAVMPLVETAMTEGRGRKKISAEKAAACLLQGLEKEIAVHDIGMVKPLRLLIRLAPGLARKIMKSG